jgi:hypothetical protein
MQLNETKNLTDYIAAGGQPDSHANHRIRSRLVEREVLHNLCSTVEFVTQHGHNAEQIDYDELLNLCSGKDWEEPGRDHISDMDRNDLLNALSEYGADLPGVDEDNEDDDADEGGDLSDDQLRQMLIAEIGNDWQGFCETERLDPHDLDVYEHWAVTSWFKNRLAERGEITGELLDFDVWGRTCTGQAISMDHVIASIAAKMEILDGQANSWAD